MKSNILGQMKWRIIWKYQKLNEGLKILLIIIPFLLIFLPSYGIVKNKIYQQSLMPQYATVLNKWKTCNSRHERKYNYCSYYLSVETEEYSITLKAFGGVYHSVEEGGVYDFRAPFKWLDVSRDNYYLPREGYADFLNPLLSIGMIVVLIASLGISLILLTFKSK